jgi:micrococcal nuclease
VQARLTRVLAIAVFSVLGFACEVEVNEEPDDGARAARVEAEVVRVVDGDTIIVAIDGHEERLRYIGIDTPESVTPDQGVECFGPEATAENARLVAGRIVVLEADEEDRDQFGRLLRYVYVVELDGSLVMVNERLVADGYAEAGSYPPNKRYEDDLRAAQEAARTRAAGLWGTCETSGSPGG